MGATDCLNAYDVEASSYYTGAVYDEVTGTVTEQSRSAKMSLDQADMDVDIMGDVKGGIASHQALAQGKVNELAEGIYNLCYATMNSECDQPEDFLLLSKQIEILPPSATGAALPTHMTVQLGHEIV